MEINKSDRFAWFNRGKILAGFGKLQESLICFERAIDLKPKYYEAWSEKATVLEQLGRIQEADFCFNQSLGAFCDDLSATLEDEVEIFSTPEDLSSASAYNQACFHAIEGNVDRALVYLEQAIKENPLKYSTMALQDTDFNSLDCDTRFQTLISLFGKGACCPI